MGRFAVIDTETNWHDKVMSIGVVIADTESFQLLDAKYHVLTPEYQVGGMLSSTLFADPRLHPRVCARRESLEELHSWLGRHGVRKLFAYNAGFDRNHLPELRQYEWFDIMRLAAYQQTNPMIPAYAECFSTGRLKRGYGVEAMLRLLSGNGSYFETHNALYDAMDELKIMRLLGHQLCSYIPL